MSNSSKNHVRITVVLLLKVEIFKKISKKVQKSPSKFSKYIVEGFFPSTLTTEYTSVRYVPRVEGETLSCDCRRAMTS